ncbi:surface lipoprotein assembly modifier [Pseudooceanicola sp. 200-1SW]|uniref:surface lipoprotein assembly modifier n=1 Tax=Pseudooceanicola sp. 200-1SW TaxID=3425949 RepID=UPI003D7FEA97
MSSATGGRPGAAGLRAGLRLCALVLGAALAVSAGAAAAADTPPERVRALVLQGDLTGARDVLLSWTPDTAEEAERRLWLLAVVYREAGQGPERLQVLEALVARRPDVARFRLELADTLADLGQRDRAGYHYEMARGGQLNPGQRARAAEGATRMEAPQRWSGRFGIAVVPSSNPGRKTQEETLDLGFGEATLNEASRAQPATGVEVQASGAYAHRFGPRTQGQIALHFNGSFFEDRDDNDLLGLIETSLTTQLAPGALLRGALSYQERYLGGDIYSRGPGLGLDLVLRSGARGRVTLGLSLTDLSFPHAPGADGLRRTLRASYSHAASSALTLRGSLRHERVDAAVAEIAATTQELGLGASYAFRGGLILDGDLAFRRTRRDGPHGLFGVVQEDHRQTLSLRLRHAEVNWKGFAPYVELRAERQRSNIAIYGYHAEDVTLGLTRRF